MSLPKLFFLLFLLLGSFSSLLAQHKSIQVARDGGSAFLENRYALLIGNDHYQDPSISTLASCRLDAERMASFLKSPKGFALPKQQMKVLLDATKSEMMDEFTSLLNTIRQPATSTFYFYYSGHGLKGSIVPSDYDSDAPETALSYTWIKDELKKRNIKANVFIIDACYAGSALPSKNITSHSYSYADAILEGSAVENFIMFTATNAYRVTPAGMHESLYTKYLLNTLNDRNADTDLNGILDAGELALQLNKQLGSSNSPQFSGGTHFPMASYPSNEVGAQILKLASSAYPQKIEPIISWRKEMNAIKDAPKKIARIISDLEADNSPEARARIGFIYRNGLGVAQNYQKALTYFIPSALEENRFALYNLGYLYAHGYGVSKNIPKAIQYYKKAADLGDAFAQHNLGCLYKLGDTQLVQIDLGKAKKWYTKSYENGLAEAAFELGKLYEQQQQTDTAITWFKNAAEMGLAAAQYELGTLYQNGLRVPQNTETAIYWLNKACKQGNLRACSALMHTEL